MDLLKTKKMGVEEFGTSGIHPGMLTGMTVIGGSIMTTEVSLKHLERGVAQIPQRTGKKWDITTEIRSIQCSKSGMIVSMSGAFTTPVRDVITILGRMMMDVGMTASFLPASTRDEPGKSYAGLVVGDMKNLDVRLNNVRFLNDGNGMTFSIGNQVRYLPAVQTVGDWPIGSVIHEAAEHIVFLGRMEDDRVPVTLSSGQAYFIKVGCNGSEQEAPLPERYAKVFGRVVGESHIAALQDSRLVFTK